MDSWLDPVRNRTFADSCFPPLGQKAIATLSGSLSLFLSSLSGLRWRCCCAGICFPGNIVVLLPVITWITVRSLPHAAPEHQQMGRIKGIKNPARQFRTSFFVVKRQGQHCRCCGQLNPTGQKGKTGIQQRKACQCPNTLTSANVKYNNQSRTESSIIV